MKQPNNENKEQHLAADPTGLKLQPVIAPKVVFNHSEVLLGCSVELQAEELEEVIAPRLSANHNETFVTDSTSR